MRSSLAAALVLAQIVLAADTAEQRGRKVVDDAIAALGGDAFLHVQDRTEIGRAYSFYDSKMSGASPVAKIYTRYLTPPGELVPGQASGGGAAGFRRGRALRLCPVHGCARGMGSHLSRRATVLRRSTGAVWDTTLHNFFYILRERLKEPEVSFYFTGNRFHR